MAAGAERVNYAIDKNCGGCRPVGLIVDFLYWLSGAHCEKGYSRSSPMPYVLRASNSTPTRIYSPRSKKLPRTTTLSRISRKVLSDKTLFLFLARASLFLYRTMKFRWRLLSIPRLSRCDLSN